MLAVRGRNQPVLTPPSPISAERFSANSTLCGITFTINLLPWNDVAGQQRRRRPPRTRAVRGLREGSGLGPNENSILTYPNGSAAADPSCMFQAESTRGHQ
jgi:hypothetical protein